MTRILVVGVLRTGTIVLVVLHTFVLFFISSRKRYGLAQGTVNPARNTDL